MLNLKNSLVNLLIILFSLFFLTNLSAEDGGFIFPKKKIISIKVDQKNKSTSGRTDHVKSFNLPQKKPLKKNFSTKKDLGKDNQAVKLVEKKELTNKIIPTNLPEKKPTLENKNKSLKVEKPYLEKETQ